MGEEETKKVESEATMVAAPSPRPPQEAPADEKAPKVSPPDKTLDPSPDDKVSASKTPAIVKKVSDPPAEKKSWDLVDRDAALTRVETEKRLALIKAWEESEKTKAENKQLKLLIRAWKKMSAIGAWENSKKASIEAQLKKIEEDFENQKAEYAEKMSNKTAEIRRAAEEKRAMVEAKRGEDILKVEEAATKFRATGNIPRRLFGCFTG